MGAKWLAMLADLKFTGWRRPVAITTAVHADDEMASSVEQLSTGELARDLRLDEVQNRLVTGAPARQIEDALALGQQRHCQVDDI